MKEQDKFDLPKKDIKDELSETQLEAYYEGRLKRELNLERKESNKEGFRNGAFLGGLLMFIFIILLLLSQNYRYNKCVKINKEELRKCHNGDYGNHDCSAYENAEEICHYTR